MGSFENNVHKHCYMEHSLFILLFLYNAVHNTNELTYLSRMFKRVQPIPMSIACVCIDMRTIVWRSNETTNHINNIKSVFYVGFSSCFQKGRKLTEKIKIKK